MKFVRGDRVEVNASFLDKYMEGVIPIWATLAELKAHFQKPFSPPVWVPLHGFVNERADFPHSGMLGTVLGYRTWRGFSMVRVTIADTKSYLFSEEVLDSL